MTNWLTIRPQLVENFESVFSNYIQTQSFDFEQGLELFNQICTFHEINDALHNYYVLDASSSTTRALLTNKLEAYFKNIFLIIDGAGIHGAFAPCLKRLFRDSGMIDITITNNFFARDEHNIPRKNASDFINLFPFSYSLKYAYDLRNAITHNIKLPIKSASNDIHELVTIYLYSTFFYYASLKTELAKRLEPRHNFTQYLLSVKTQFTHKIGRFVHIDGQEDISLMQSHAVEHVDYNDRSIERKGTIDELRKNSIPEKRMMIWGDAGTGKSTSLEYLAYIDAENCLSDSSLPIPVYLPLALLTDDSVSIIDSISNKIGIDFSYADKLLKDGSINLFLDGINEIPKDDNYRLKNLRNNQIQNLLASYPNCFVIISNRPQDIQIFSSVPVFRLLRMDDTQIENFLSRNVIDLTIRNNISLELSNNPRLKDIVRIPLMLSRFIDVATHRGEMPRSRGEIIHHFITGLYDRERVEKKDAAFDVFIINRLLANLGHESLEKNETNSGLTESAVMSEFIKVKKEIGSGIDLSYVLRIVTELGILEKREGLYMFAHQEYQDYFNAEQERINAGL